MRKPIDLGFLLCFWLTLVYSGFSVAFESEIAAQNGQATEQALQELAQHQEALTNLLAEVEKRYGETASLLRQLRRDIERENATLSKIRADMDVLHQEVAKQNKELAAQIKSAFVMGRQEKLKLILNQQDPELSSRMMNYYHYLNKARVVKLAGINRSVKRLEELELDRQQQTTQLEKKLAKKNAEQLILDDARKQRNELLAQLNDDSPPDTDQLNFLLENEAKLRNVITSLQNADELFDGKIHESSSKNLVDGSENERADSVPESEPAEMEQAFSRSELAFTELKGKLPWPVKGKLAQKFGSPRFDSVWDGVLIEATEGADIRAVTWGKIVYAEWLRGYGLLIIIDHGQDYMSLYAFNQSLYKHVGDKVNAGEIIASVGQSGGRNQPGLYFGLRKKGLPIDPLEWCVR
jgi:septal ring factor EnvC (AmiA/AmiB activator)